MVCEILKYPSPELMKRSVAVSPGDTRLGALVDDLFETMYGYNGVGLAAPQVGVLERVVAIDTRQLPEEKIVLVNPEIVLFEGEEEGEEGCLSLPELYAPVKRAARIKVVAEDVSGGALDFEAEGFFARVIQHEVDHLEGRLFIDRLDIITRHSVLNEWLERMAREGRESKRVTGRGWSCDSRHTCL